MEIVLGPDHPKVVAICSKVQLASNQNRRWLRNEMISEESPIEGGSFYGLTGQEARDAWNNIYG